MNKYSLLLFVSGRAYTFEPTRVQYLLLALYQFYLCSPDSTDLTDFISQPWVEPTRVQYLLLALYQLSSPRFYLAAQILQILFRSRGERLLVVVEKNRFSPLPCCSLVSRNWLLPFRGRSGEIQKLASPAYIPGGSNKIAGFVIITPKNAITV